MAVIASQVDSVMVVECQTGLTPEGSPILSTFSISGIKSATSDQDIYDVAVALYGLGADPLISVRRTNRIDLAE